MNLTYWSLFTKRKNSTLQPTGAGVTVACKLKEGTSLLNPTLLVDANVMTATYAQFNGKYWFVSNVVSVNGLWEISLTMDTLATYKTLIGDYSALIVRTGDATWFNPTLKDDLNPPTEEVIYETVESDGLRTYIDPSTSAMVQKFYILSCVADAAATPSATNQNGFARTYLLYPSEMTQLSIELCASQGSIIDDLKNKFGNAMEGVVSCHMMTFSTDNAVMPKTMERLKIGGVNTNKDAAVLHSRVFKSGIIDLNLPSRWVTNVETYGDADPYVTMTVYLPYVGIVPLDYSTVAKSRKLRYQIVVDFVTGELEYVFYNALGTAIQATYTGNMATTCPLSASADNVTGKIAGGVMTIGGIAAATIASGGAAGAAAVAAGLGTAMGGASTFANSLEVHTQVNGNVSSSLGMELSKKVIINYYRRKPAHGIADIGARNGLMCMKVGKPSDHPGYCQFLNPSLAIPDFDSIRDQVNALMASGFYYE